MKKIVFGQLGQLKPDKIEEYCKLHANAWPGVLKGLTECNLHNYSIFLHGNLVFAYFEYTGDDYEADMAKADLDPINREWWQHTKPCFEKFAIGPESEFYHDMKQIFYHE